MYSLVFPALVLACALNLSAAFLPTPGAPFKAARMTAASGQMAQQGPPQQIPFQSFKGASWLLRASSKGSADDVGGLELTNDDGDGEFELPDRALFTKYFRQCTTGAKDKMITKEQFTKYGEVQALLKEEMVMEEDVSQLWDAIGGSDKGLAEEEAYQMLCMITDLPNADDTEYLDEEFARMAGLEVDPETGDYNPAAVAAATITYKQFMGWDEIKDMVKEDMLTKDELDSIWLDVAGDKKTPITRDQFDSVNMAIDGALGDSFGEEDGEQEEGDIDGDAEVDIEVAGEK